MSQIIRIVGTPLLLLALTLLLFVDLVRHPDQLLATDTGDILYQHLPAKHFWLTSFRATGEFPLWCPTQFAGSPFLHDPQVGIFYPLNWPLLLLPTEALPSYLSWMIVLHVWIAGLAMAGFARYRGLSEFGAIVAATSWMFAGKWLLHILVAGHTILSGLAWLPLAVWGIERAIRTGSFVSALGGGVAFSLIAFSVHPQWVAYSALLLVIWSIGVVAEPQSDAGTRRLTRLRRFFTLGALGGATALGLYAVQLLPTWEATQASLRDFSGDRGLAGVSTKAALGNLLAVPLTEDYVSWEAISGWGIVSLFLIGLLRGAREFRTRLVLGVWVLLTMLALVPEWIWGQLPVFRMFRIHLRLMTLVAFPMALLMGDISDRWVRGEFPQLLKRGLLGSVMILAFVVIGAGLFILELWPKVTFLLHPYWLILPVLIAMLAMLIREQNPITRMRLRPIWLSILLLESGIVLFPLVEVRPAEPLLKPTPIVAALAERIQPTDRAMDRGWSFPMTEAPSETEIPLTPFGGGAYVAVHAGIPTIGGYNPLDVGWYRRYWRWVQDRPVAKGVDFLQSPFLGDVPIRNPKLIDLLGVRYCLSPLDRPPPADWKLVAQQGPAMAYHLEHPRSYDIPAYGLFENPNVMPRAFVVEKLLPMPEDAESARNAMRDNDFRTTALVSNLPSAMPQPQPGASKRTATITEYQPNRVVVEVEAGRVGMLVLTDVWFSEWTARIDGQLEPILRVNGCFRGVVLPSTSCKVEFRIESQSLNRGATITIITMVLVGVGFVFGWLRNRGAVVPKVEMASPSIS
ncbi:YfhO family protein [Tuwongella immobilis]|uniref:Membrane protein 6-pyruvoyl-tetrahydropterin synthase-related domain-containing protein n=1 Tax=Tuwongella immobilis TaxID=692036 RepID=A0A6C2YMH9_9BACT|nr:YfhO family protein [Tuwongella immobilis]VIP02122.1 Putative uncharacterized protein OS=Candidatus Kuenenia stuttgartiensis GN=kustc0433 PE=4 SV=1 [Tuwongella immobilis]VTS00452.1 Putative uncharacterized protein OS=Candidatus Kuenenia stuttgartiensis GN=kustc0433 PE=4 SV=1 [Tuwongella immobilis]